MFCWWGINKNYWSCAKFLSPFHWVRVSCRKNVYPCFCLLYGIVLPGWTCASLWVLLFPQSAKYLWFFHFWGILTMHMLFKARQFLYILNILFIFFLLAWTMQVPLKSEPRLLDLTIVYLYGLVVILLANVPLNPYYMFFPSIQV